MYDTCSVPGRAWSPDDPRHGAAAEPTGTSPAAKYPPEPAEDEVIHLSLSAPCGEFSEFPRGGHSPSVNMCPGGLALPPLPPDDGPA
jgi:hypothetical protein